MGVWANETRRQIVCLQNARAEMARWARESGATEDETRLLLRPYEEQIDQLCKEDLPLAMRLDDLAAGGGGVGS